MAEGSFRRGALTGIFLATVLFVAETTWATLVGGDPLTFSFPAYGLSWALLVAVVLIFLGLAGAFNRPGTTLGFWTLMGVSWTIVLIRLARDAGPLRVTVVALASVPFLMLMLLRGPRFRGELPAPLGSLPLAPGRHPRFWALVAVFVGVVTPSVYQLYARMAVAGTAPILALLLLEGLIAAALPSLEALYPRLERSLWNHRGWTVGMLVLLLVLGSASSFEASPFGFQGTLGEVHLSERRSNSPLPNIILISIDTLRLDDLEPSRAPHLNRLRGHSLVFENHFAPSGWTLPSHATLFTGLQPRNHGAVRRGHPIPSSLPTYPMYLRRVGYRTAAFTGGGLVRAQLGFARGFDRYEHYPFLPPTRRDRFLPGALHQLDRAARALTGTPLVSDDGTREPLRRTRFQRTAGAARRWIRRRGNDRPFFLFLHTYQVHDWFRSYPESLRKLRRTHPNLVPYLLPASRLSHDLPALPAPQRRLLRRLLEPDQPLVSVASTFLQTWSPPRPLPDTFYRRPIRTVRAMENLSNEETARLRGIVARQLRAQRLLYRYGIETVDEVMGSFLAFLRDRGLYRDSLIVLYSDHGEGFSLRPLVLQHDVRGRVDRRGQLHESLIHVPLWIKLPRGEGEVRGEFLETRDVFPMILQWMGLELNDRPLTTPVHLTARNGEGRTFVSGSNKTGRFGLRPLFYVRGRGHKLVVELRKRTVTRRDYWKVGPDVERERLVPEEQVPPETRRRLDRFTNTLLDRYRQRPDPFGKQPLEPSPAVRRKLRALGYIQ